MEKQITSVGSTQEAHTVFMDPIVQFSIDNNFNPVLTYVSIRFNYNGSSEKVSMHSEEIGNKTIQEVIAELLVNAENVVKNYLDQNYPV